MPRTRFATLHNIPYRKFRIATPGRSAAGLLALSPLALHLACAPDARAFLAPGGALTVDADPLVLGPVPIDQVAVGALTLTNPAATPAALAVSVEGAGFAAATELLDVPAGGSAALELSFAPASGQPVDGVLTLDDALTVALRGLADPDGDDDGAAHPMAGGDDCDDADPEIGPDAVETWYDGVDQDCDGNDDDADGDGSPVDEDCDDEDARRTPGAVEEWYDGVDQDCDGNDDDADGDGSPLAEDCDDAEPTVYPGAAEAIDGVDQDCDGITDEDGATSGTALLSELFPENPYKTTGSDEYLELWLKDGRALGGWVLTSTASSGTLEQLAPVGTTWLLLCSAGLADDQPDCGAVVDPWPRLDRQRDTLTLSVEGRVVDTLAWDEAWGLDGGGLQLDRAAVGPAVGDEANDAASGWCDLADTPAGENLPCP